MPSPELLLRPHHLLKRPHVPWQETPSSIVPADVRAALQLAMQLERVPPHEFNDLLWIMAQESAGIVDARIPQSTGRGLYQLLKAQYALNPKGTRSFGNAVEECQGGIRYILGRYRSASRARAFWALHDWY